MLFAGWEVRIVKNCDQGHENAARGRRQITLPSRQITYIYFRAKWRLLFIYTMLFKYGECTRHFWGRFLLYLNSLLFGGVSIISSLVAYNLWTMQLFDLALILYLLKLSACAPTAG